MDVGDRTEELIGVELDKQGRHHLFHLDVLFHHAVECVGDEIHDHVEVDLLRFLSVGVKELAHLYAVGVPQRLQDFQLSILVPLVLKDLLYRNRLSRLGNCRLEHNAKRTVAHNLLSVIGQALQTSLVEILVKSKS